MTTPKNSKESQSTSPVESIPKGYQAHTLYRQDPESGEISIAGGFLAPRGTSLETLWEEYIYGTKEVEVECCQLRMFQSFADWLLEEQGIQVLKSETPPAVETPGQ